MTCPHSSTAEVYPEHELVCTDCGVVVSKILDDRFLIIDELEDNESSIMLKDMAMNGHFPESVIPDALILYRIMRLNIDLKNFTRKELLSYAFYEQLIRDSVPRTISEICFYAGVKPIRFWKIEKVMMSEIALNPAGLVSKIAQELSIPFEHNPKIMFLVSQLESTSSAKPETLVGAAVMIVKKETGLKIKLKDLERACGVSHTAMRALVKQHNK